MNVPLRSGPGDAEYLRIFRRVLQPLAFDYMPEIVLLSAGFDIYFRDPLGGMKVTPSGFGMLARVLMDIADECCGGKFAAVLEGGYHLGGLTEGIKVVLDEMSSATRVTEADLRRHESEADASDQPDDRVGHRPDQAVLEVLPVKTLRGGYRARKNRVPGIGYRV